MGSNNLSKFKLAISYSVYFLHIHDFQLLQLELELCYTTFTHLTELMYLLHLEYNM